MPKKIKDKTISKIREEYVIGELSLAAIARKYKISFNSLKKYAKEYGWDERGSVNKLMEATKFIMNEKIKAMGDEDKINLINKVEKTALQDIQKKLEVDISLNELRQMVFENHKMGAMKVREMFQKPTISKSVVITTKDKNGNFAGEKKIVETRELDGHEIAGLIKTETDKYKTFCQTEPQAPAVVINNNNAQMQVSEALKQDLQDLNERLISANIDNLTDEN